ncbi:MAG TPA: cyclic pyranopterin monophosphate synthase MoaC [Nitrososphaerales archaeon]|nr:cyclic pyranopterin monophosphate synthase MoaC [Nitrososphaerales archaeon]
MATEVKAVPFKQVDISEKPVVYREATAKGKIRLRKETVARAKRGGVEKGDVVEIATLTSVLGAKKTTEIVALTHLLRIEKIEPKVKLLEDGLEVTVTVKAHEKTGVEMEALAGVSVALLNVWDVVKQYEKDSSGQYPSTVIESIRVVKKVKGIK